MPAICLEEPSLLKPLRTTLFASLTALGTFIAIPLPYVILGGSHLPNADEWFAWHFLSGGVYTTSGQLVGLGVAATFLGPVGAFMSQLVYLCMGLAGLPVFADGGGLRYMGTAGFASLIAFPFAAWLAARLAMQGGLRRRFLSLLAAQALVMAVGMVAQVSGAGQLGLGAAWAHVAFPISQTILGLTVAMLPLAVLGALGDRMRALIPVLQPAPPERPVLPATTGEEPPLRPQLAGPPPRLSLPEMPQRKALEGPPPRVSLPETPQDS